MWEIILIHCINSIFDTRFKKNTIARIEAICHWVALLWAVSKCLAWPHHQIRLSLKLLKVNWQLEKIYPPLESWSLLYHCCHQCKKDCNLCALLCVWFSAYEGSMLLSCVLEKWWNSTCVTILKWAKQGRRKSLSLSGNFCLFHCFSPLCVSQVYFRNWVSEMCLLRHLGCSVIFSVGANEL